MTFTWVRVWTFHFLVTFSLMQSDCRSTKQWRVKRTFVAISVYQGIIEKIKSWRVKKSAFPQNFTHDKESTSFRVLRKGKCDSISHKYTAALNLKWKRKWWLCQQQTLSVCKTAQFSNDNYCLNIFRRMVHLLWMKWYLLEADVWPEGCLSQLPGTMAVTQELFQALGWRQETIWINILTPESMVSVVGLHSLENLRE